jgi:glycosyltransferase involved in cell wall biosynthesis
VNQPSVSVVICCYTTERLKDLHEAVASVLAQTLKPHEVIVAVDNNQDLFHRLVSELPPPVRVVANTGTPGLSETRNVGIRASTGAIVAFLDDDATAESDWLEKLVPPFEDHRVAAVGGQAVPVWPGATPPFWFPDEFDFVIGCTAHKELMLQAGGEIRNVTGSNMAFPREAFDKVGSWETMLGRCELGRTAFNPTGGEEAEICLRIRSMMPDAVILFRPESVVHHKVSPGRATLRYMFSFCYREGLTRAVMRQVVSRYGRNPLAAESLFLRRLVLSSLPRRLLRFYSPSSLAQAAVISLNIALMGTGYAVGRWKYRSGAPS